MKGVSLAPFLQAWAMSASTDYLPLNVEISSITRGKTTTVVTDSAHYYAVGQLVRFHVPKPYGMEQINDLAAYVLSIPTTTSLVVDVNSLNYTAFNSSPTYPGNTSPQVSPVGDRNNTTSNLTITGAFINNTTPNN